MKKMIPDNIMPTIKIIQAIEFELPSEVTVFPRSLNAEFQKEKELPYVSMLRENVIMIRKISMVKRELISLFINSDMIRTYENKSNIYVFIKS